MNYKIFLLLLFPVIILPGTIIAQDSLDFSKLLPGENIHTIESINPMEPGNADLEFLDKELRDVEIVMLGEQSHGDGSTFRAKSRLIRYLHEEQEFNVLVFESGLIDAYRVWEKIQSGADSISVFDDGIFPVWTKSAELRELFQYILEQSKTDQPLIVAGFDMQPTGMAISADERWSEIRDYLSAVIDFEEEKYPAFSNVFQNLRSVFQNPLSDEQFKAMEDEFRILQNEVLNADPSVKGKLQAQYLNNYFNTIRLYSKADLKKPPNTPHIFNIRDKEMAANFSLLKEQIYEGEKFVVWGANSHLGYGRGLLGEFEGSEPSAPAMVPMGQYLKIDYQEKLYTIAFTSYEGSIGSLRGTVREIPKGHEKSLEKWMADQDFEYAFISLKAENMKTFRFPARIYGHAEMSGIWAQMTDGIFFIREMEASTQ